MSRTCYIVGAGEFFGSFAPLDDDFVIAADGGYAELISRGIRCDLLVGDLDSLKSVANDVKTLTFPPEKDDTDMRLAYLEGKKRGYTSFEIYGGTGGRSDHTFANYCLLYEMKLDGCEARLHGRSDIAYIIRNEATRGGGSSNKYISVFAFSEKASGVCIQGLKYEVTDAILQPHFPLGVSNQKTGGEYEISVSDGTLLIIEEL